MDVFHANFSETNLKVRQSIPETAEMEDDIDELSRFDGRFSPMLHS